MIVFVDAHRARFGVAPICRVLSQHGVPIAPSTYYAARHRPRSARSMADEAMLAEVTRVHSDPTIGRGLYGARKVWHQLRREGTTVSRCRVERLMRTAGLQGVRRGKAFVTTKANSAATRPPDLVGRDFTAAGPNQLWVVDFTYVPTWSGMAFTAFVSDVFSRRIVGWRTASRMPTELPLDALEMALWTRAGAGQAVAGLIHHSDAGTQGGINRSSQHLDQEVRCGTTCRVDGYEDWEAGDEVAWSAAGPSRCRARVLAEGRRGTDQRGRGSGLRRVGSGWVAVVPRAWRYAFDRAWPVFG